MKVLIIIILASGAVFCQLSRSGLSDTISSNSLSIQYSDSLYNTAASKITFIDYNDCNNCPLRAAVMTFVFSKLYPEIKTAKVWVFAGPKLSSLKDHYKTRRKDYLTGIESCLQWGFHVAPVAIFGSDTLVIDPSTQNRPVNISDWSQKISAGTASLLIIKENVNYSFPGDPGGLFDDTVRFWDTKKIFVSAESEVSFLAQRLTMAYNKFFDPVRFRYYRDAISSVINPKR